MPFLSASSAVSMGKFYGNTEKDFFTRDFIELREMVKESLELYKYAKVLKLDILL